jgi:hypothetical protein
MAKTKFFLIILVLILIFFVGYLTMSGDVLKYVSTALTSQYGINKSSVSVTTTTITVTPVPPETAELTGAVLVSGLSDKGFQASYDVYKFKIEEFLYDNGNIYGMTFAVMRPDAMIIVVRATTKGPAVLSDEGLEMTFPVEYARDSGKEKTASLYVRKRR